MTVLIPKFYRIGVLGDTTFTRALHETQIILFHIIPKPTTTSLQSIVYQ